MNLNKLKELAKTARYFSLWMSTQAGSGHPTSSLSAADLMVTLFFGGFYKYDLENPKNPNNDRMIFSKGHASPLFYALYYLAGKISEEDLKTYRKLGSKLEGHPRPNFSYVEAATGSLGQGLSIGAGMAINAKYIDNLPYKTFVLLGDSEIAEGSIWEAVEIAAHYKLDNLIAILDLNRLGQRGETLFGHNVQAVSKRFSAFDWNVISIDGHSIEKIIKAYTQALQTKDKPTIIIAKTLKGKGISFLENQNGWHGKPLNPQEFEQAAKEFGKVNLTLKSKPAKPKTLKPKLIKTSGISQPVYPPDKPIATRKAYGNALKRIYPGFPNIVVLDAEVSNSTYSEIFQKDYPNRFFEMYIAEQNMVGVAQGFSRLGKIPFLSTFAAFLTRAHDQIRMSQYSEGNIKFVGSHAGVSIGEDGPSQMGLEDIALFRSMLGSTVLYPSDAISCEKLVEEAAKHKGNVYIRTTRKETPVLYTPNENFPIGGSKTLRHSTKDVATVAAAGITLHEALSAYEELKKEGIMIRVVDLYSIKPLDLKTLQKAALETKAIIVVEDHYPEGGIGEAVAGHLGGVLDRTPREIPIISLAVRKISGSGKPDELLALEGINKDAIARQVKTLIS